MSQGGYVTLVGFVAQEPSIRSTPTGKVVTKVRVGATPRYKDANGQWRDAETSYYDVTCWNRLAHHVRGSLHKGDPVVLKGRFRTSSFEDKHGNMRTSIEITADTVGHDLNRGTATYLRPQVHRVAPEYDREGDRGVPGARGWSGPVTLAAPVAPAMTSRTTSWMTRQSSASAGRSMRPTWPCRHCARARTTRPAIRLRTTKMAMKQRQARRPAAARLTTRPWVRCPPFPRRLTERDSPVLNERNAAPDERQVQITPRTDPLSSAFSGWSTGTLGLAGDLPGQPLGPGQARPGQARPVRSGAAGSV